MEFNEAIGITWFEWPGRRSGDAPEALNEAIARVGVGRADGREVEEYFALAEEFTGVRLTPGLLDQAVLSTGIVAPTGRAHEHGWRWTGPDPTHEELAARAVRIRAWAPSVGIRVPDGPIPAAIASAYDACHSEDRLL